MSDGIPPGVEEAAKQRAAARADRDWATADRLRTEIETAGWRVIDSGTAYRLAPASPPDVQVGGEIRYGRSEAVPSRLEEASIGLASVVVVVSADSEQTRRALDGLASSAPAGIDVVLVADGLSDRALEPLGAWRRGADEDPDADVPVPTELVRTSEPLGHAAAVNVGIRRARAAVVVVLDPSIVPGGDVVTPLVRALDDDTVAIASPFGLRSTDLRRFDEVLAATGPVDAAAVQGYLMAFRRSDAAARGPLDEGFRFYRNLDIWWSLVLRDEGPDRPPRRAVVVPGLDLERGQPRAWTTTAPAERDRLSKRNFYRILDRFRGRSELAVG